MKKKRLTTLTVRIIFILLVIAFFVWGFQGGYFAHIYQTPQEFFVLLRQHLKLVGLSSLFAVCTAIPVGIFVTRPSFRKSKWLFLGIANLGQTIPSLAVLALAIGILGIGYWPAVFALYVYSVLPILRNTVAGIDSIDRDLIDAAKGMGFKPYQILLRIELPNAAYSIISGVRTAIVINIGTAALAFLVGGGGLGDWIFTGISLFDSSYLLSGAVPVTILAIIVDFLLRLVEILIVPKFLRQSIAGAN